MFHLFLNYQGRIVSIPPPNEEKKGEKLKSKQNHIVALAVRHLNPWESAGLHVGHQGGLQRQQIVLLKLAVPTGSLLTDAAKCPKAGVRVDGLLSFM